MKPVLYGLLLLIFGIGAARAQAPKADPGSPFGMGIYFGNRYSNEEMERAGRMAQEAGIKWSREEFSWSNIQPEKGKWVWDRYDQALETAARYGISLFGLLDYSSAWASTAPPEAKSRWNHMPDLAAWSEYVFKIVSRYKGKIKHWEIWNEPNISVFWQPAPNVEDYTKLLKAGYEAVKRADPAAKVIGVCTAGSDLGFIESVFKAGGFRYMDILSTHPYRYPASPEASGFTGELRRTRDLLERYGGTKPIWLTEIGWPAHRGDNGVSEEEQAQMITRAYLQAIASGAVDKIFWYDYRDDGDDRAYNEHNFGILRRDFSPKPAYIAYKTMANKLAGLKFAQSLDIGEGNTAYLFSAGKRSVIAAWSAEGERTATIRVSSSKVELTDGMGQTQKPALFGEAVALALKPLPQYLGFIGGQAEGDDPMAEFIYDRMRIARGDRGRVTMILRNPSAKPVPVSASIRLPAGWTAAKLAQQLSIPADSREIMSFEIAVPADAKEPQTVAAQIKVGPQTLSASCRIEILEPVSLNLRPGLKKAGDPLAVTVGVQNNRRSGPASGTVKLIAPEGWRLEPERFTFENVSPYAEKTFTARLIGGALDRNADYTIGASAALGDGITVSASRPVGFMVALRAKKPPAIDGSLEDWADAIPMELNRKEQVRMENWGGQKDLSARAYIMWDETAVYFAVKVADDKFHQPYAGEDIWQGDSIQMGFAPFPRPGPQDYFETGMALTEKGRVVWAWHTAMGLPTGPMDMLPVAIRRTEDGVVYEAAVPQAAALGIVPGKVIGFSLLVNDNDGQGRRGWIEWGGGIGPAKDPALYRYVTFTD
ncbi:MAG: beta-galactosidase [Armatimonadetes bacterium]|nr:beta-galactosidase [Armatimonadota bacterium]